MEVKQTARRLNQTAKHSDTYAVYGPVLLLCPYHFGIRNFIHSTMLASLDRLGFQAYVLARTLDATATSASGSVAGNQQYMELPAPVLKRPRHVLSALDVLHRASFYRRHSLSSEEIIAWWERLHDPFRRRAQHAVIETLAIIGSQSPFYEWQLAGMQQVQRQTWNLSSAKQLLQEQHPAVVVATSCVSQLEEPFLLAARDLGIPTIGFVQSFDNLTCHSWISDCDSYAVWNQRMKDQLLSYHRVRNPAQVYITGTPQFDFHVQPAFRWGRASTLKRLGLQPDDRYILYAANAFGITPSEPTLVEELVRRCAQTPELRTHRLVVRLHPNDDFSRWDQLEAQHPQVSVSRPSRKSKSFSSPEDQALLVSTLLHADVCHNMWSSMSLDAAVVDTPVVCVAFASDSASPEHRFCQAVYATDFYRPIAESGGVRLAHTMDQLVAETIAYVNDRSRDRTQREQMAATECGPLDGDSAERIAELIASIAAQAH